MDLWLFADGDIGGRTLDYLAGEYAADVSLVVTMADNDIGRAAAGYGFPVMLYNEIDSFMDSTACRRPDLGMLAWWPKIIGKRLLSVPRHGFVNTHPSLLPYNRGKNYNFWALAEQTPFGVSIHAVTEGVDDGDIIAQAAIPYDWADTGGSLYRKAQDAMFELIRKTYPELRGLRWNAVPQKEGEGSFHLGKEMEAACEISLDREYKARELLNLLRARTFPGHPACWFEDGGRRFEARIEIIESGIVPPPCS